MCIRDRHKAGVKKLLIDLQGPELRIGRLPQPLSLTAGQTVRLGAQGIPPYFSHNRWSRSH